MLTVEDKKVFKNYLKNCKPTQKQGIMRLYNYLIKLPDEIPLKDWESLYLKRKYIILWSVSKNTFRTYNSYICHFLEDIKKEDCIFNFKHDCKNHYLSKQKSSLSHCNNNIVDNNIEKEFKKLSQKREYISKAIINLKNCQKECDIKRIKLMELALNQNLLLWK